MKLFIHYATSPVFKYFLKTVPIKFESPHDKTNKWTHLPSNEIDLSSLIRACCLYEVSLDHTISSEHTAKAMVRLSG